MSLPSISLPTANPLPPSTSAQPPSTSADPSTSAPPTDPTDPPTDPPDPSTSSGGGGSSGDSSGGSSGGGSGSSTPGPSSSSTTEETTPTESSTETTLSESSTSVYESASVITSDGQAITTKVQVTTVIGPGTVITSPAKASDDGGGAPVGAIVGGVIGGIAALLAIGALIFFLLKRRRNNFDKQFDGNFDPDYVSKHGTGPTAFATGALAGGAHRKSHSLEKGGRQRVNLNTGDRPSVDAALAEDDGMGGRLDASTVGGGIVMPFPYPQGQGGAQSQGYGQAPYNPAMSPPPMSTHLPNSPPGGPNMALGAAGAGYYAGHHGHGQQQPYAYGQQPYGQGYPDRHGAISPSTTDGGTHSYPNSANPYLSGAASSSGHGHGVNPYGGYTDPSGQSMYGGTAPSVTGTSTSGYGAFGGAAAALSEHSGSGGGAKSQTTGMSAKEREARGMRPNQGLGVVNPDEQQQLQPEPRREGSGGSILPSPFDASGSSSAGGSTPAVGGVGGKEAEANATRRQSQHGVVVHQDGGRVPDEEETSPGEIPPAYDAILYEQRK